MSDTTRLTGQVKWFNKKSGYGFLTLSNSESTEKTEDIFMHHSAIQVQKEQYRYLMQGEYVTFELSSVDSGEHKCHAVNVRGINGGKLMCELRNETRAQYDTAQSAPRQKYVSRSEGYSKKKNEGEVEWMQVRRTSSTKDVSSPRPRSAVQSLSTPCPLSTPCTPCPLSTESCSTTGCPRK